MTINLNDRSLITSYIQIILRDYSGLSVKFPNDLGRDFIDDWYEVTSSSPVRVTGTYDLETYAAASLYMAINFPNEQFPYRYDEVEGQIVKTPYDRNKLNSTISWIKTWFSGSISEEVYTGQNPDFSVVFDWTTLMRYFSSENSLKDCLKNNKSLSEIFNDTVLVFIVHNMEFSIEDKEVTSLSERVLSYFFNEVVTPISDRDEVYRVQKKIYDKIPKNSRGIYLDDMSERVKTIQQRFIDIHTVDDGETRRVNLPDGFEDFKVTGYVDPWTELLIDGGVY